MHVPPHTTTPDDFTGPVNMGNPGEFTIRELAEKVIELTNSSSRLICEPLPGDDPKQRRPDISLAREVLGWEPKVQLEEGLKKRPSPISIHYSRRCFFGTFFFTGKDP